MSEDELRQEIAVMLFRNDRLTLGQASELAGMNRLAFQRLLSSLEIPLHYDVADFEDDLRTLRRLDRL
jgi:predicted HTH domain antitoxin